MLVRGKSRCSRWIPSGVSSCVRHQSVAVFDATEGLLARTTISKAAEKSIDPFKLSFYWDTQRPTRGQLSYARHFFHVEQAQISFSAMKFYQMVQTGLPEVAFFGRSNVGKSSLLNGLFGVPIARVSNNPGMTRSLNAYTIGGADAVGNQGRINVLDTPGYGKGSRLEWGKEIIKYLAQRKE